MRSTGALAAEETDLRAPPSARLVAVLAADEMLREVPKRRCCWQKPRGASKVEERRGEERRGEERIEQNGNIRDTVSQGAQE